ncbi:hypothetical protein BDR03DRAFT_1007631 [Suillus americanus]|nr:hypothetical protein BDR03DRAFT_1007631 [Suillus americanus]
MSSSFHKDKVGVNSEHIMDVFKTPSRSREASTRSPLTSPTKPRFHPYLKSRGTAAATTQFALDSLQGLTAKELNPGTALMAKDVFTRGPADLPDDMLCEGAMAQYTTCEFLASASKHLETQHNYCKTDLEIWEQACTHRGLKDLFHNKAFYEHSTSQGTLTLAVLQEQARQLKEHVKERGADTDGDRSEGSRSGGSDYEPMPSSAISIMPPKSTQGKKPQWKKPQNSRQIRKPARRSNENPCLNADDSQVGCIVEQTEQPELECDDTLSVLHEEEMLDSESDDFNDVASQHEPPQSLIHHQPPYNNHHPEQYSSVYHPPFPQHEPQMHAPPFQPQHIQHPEINQVPFQRPFMPQTPFPPMNQPPYQPPYAHQMDNSFHQHRPHLNWTPSLQCTMTAEELFLSCSINELLPPTVRGADRLSRHLRYLEARSMRPSPYALPGLRKVTVFGPHRWDKHYHGEWQNIGVVHAGSSKKVAQKCPTAKDLPPHPLPPLNISVASVQHGAPAHPHPHAQPIQSHNDGGSDPHLDLPQQEAQTTQANRPIPIPADINTSEVAHKLQIVPALTTHLQCLFTSANITLDGILQSVAMLQHDGLVSLVIEILWAHGFYKDINFDDPTALDGVIALAGAALCSTLLEYKADWVNKVLRKGGEQPSTATGTWPFLGLEMMKAWLLGQELLIQPWHDLETVFMSFTALCIWFQSPFYPKSVHLDSDLTWIFTAHEEGDTKAAYDKWDLFCNHFETRIIANLDPYFKCNTITDLLKTMRDLCIPSS